MNSIDAESDSQIKEKIPNSDERGNEINSGIQIIDQLSVEMPTSALKLQEIETVIEDNNENKGDNTHNDFYLNL